MSDQNDLALADAWRKRGEGKYGLARMILRDVEAQCDDSDFATRGRIFHIRMQIESDHDRYVSALGFATQTLACYLETEDCSKIAHSQRHLAYLHEMLGNYSGAEQNYREAIHLYRTCDTALAIDFANALGSFAAFLEKRNQWSEAKEIWLEALDKYSLCDIPEGVSEATARIENLAERD